MTKEQTKNLFRRIKSHYQEFTVDDFKVDEWYKELRDYDYDDVTKRFELHLNSEDYGQVNIFTVWVGYDQWGAPQWAEEMKNNGYTLETVIQGAKTMSTPMKILAADLESKKINYNNNPILKWCLTNTQIEIDKNDNIRPVKGRNAKQRIDGAVSLIDAYVVYQRHYDDFFNL